MDTGAPLLLTWKEHELLEDAKRYSPDVAGISSTKRRGSNTVKLDDEWKLFYSGVEPAQLALAGVDILVSPRLASCVDEWIPLEARVCMLRLKLNRPLCLRQVCCQNSNALHPEFVKKQVMPCEGFNLTNPRSFWETSMLMLGMMSVYGRMKLADVVILT